MDFDGIRIESVRSLSAAAATGNVELLQKFISEDREDQQDNRGWRAIHHAIHNKHTECIKLLMTYEKSDINWSTFMGYTPLHFAVMSSDLPTLRTILSSSTVELNALHTLEGSCVHMALEQGSKALEILQILIEKGVDLNLKDGYERSPLHLAIDKDCPSECLELLLESGVEKQARDYAGRTPLMITSELNNLRALDLLISSCPPNSRAAMINTRSNFGHTALFFAVLDNAPEFVERLCEEGADANDLVAYEGLPLLGLALEMLGPSSETVRFLLKYMDLEALKSNPDIISSIFYLAGKKSNDPDCLKALCEYKMDFNGFLGDLKRLIPHYLISIVAPLPNSVEVGFLFYYILNLVFREELNDPWIMRHLLSHVKWEEEVRHPLAALALNTTCPELKVDIIQELLDAAPPLKDKDIEIIALFGDFRLKQFLFERQLLSPGQVLRSMESFLAVLSSDEQGADWNGSFVRSLLMNVYILALTLGERNFIERVRSHPFFADFNPDDFWRKSLALCSNPKSLRQLSRNHILEKAKSCLDMKTHNIPEACWDLFKYSDIYEDEGFKKMITVPIPCPKYRFMANHVANS